MHEKSGERVRERERKSEQALSESEQRFCKIFQAAPALVSITTLLEGIHLEVNETFLRTLGYQRGEVIGRSGLELDLWADPGARVEVVEALGRGSVRELEVVLRGKSGRLITGLLSAELIDVKGKQFLVTLVNDITERKKAQAEQMRLAAMVQSSEDAIIGKTLDGYITDWNRGAEKLYGYSAGEAIGRHMSMLIPPGNPDVVSEILEKLRKGERIEHFETERITKDGRIIQVSSSISPICDRDGKIIGAATIARDITERRQSQKQIELLITRLAARTAELEAIVPELEAFNYTVSHDLRTPLTVIGGYCERIRSDCADHLDERCAMYLAEIEAGASRMEELMDTLLSFSHLARVDLKKQTVDLSALAREVAAELQLSATERPVRFEIADGVTLQGDEGMLRIVLENLLGNAWKFTEGKNDAVIGFGATKVEGLVACYVKDNGQGFDMAQADQLFAPFKRLPGAEKYRGFGIGLATVERIVKRHGGKIWAEGAPGKGATFFFTL